MQQYLKYYVSPHKRVSAENDCGLILRRERAYYMRIKTFKVNKLTISTELDLFLVRNAVKFKKQYTIKIHSFSLQLVFKTLRHIPDVEYLNIYCEGITISSFINVCEKLHYCKCLKHLNIHYKRPTVFKETERISNLNKLRVALLKIKLVSHKKPCLILDNSIKRYFRYDYSRDTCLRLIQEFRNAIQFKIDFRIDIIDHDDIKILEKIKSFSINKLRLLYYGFKIINNLQIESIRINKISFIASHDFRHIPNILSKLQTAKKIQICGINNNLIWDALEYFSGLPIKKLSLECRRKVYLGCYHGPDNEDLEDFGFNLIKSELILAKFTHLKEIHLKLDMTTSNENKSRIQILENGLFSKLIKKITIYVIDYENNITNLLTILRCSPLLVNLKIRFDNHLTMHSIYKIIKYLKNLHFLTKLHITICPKPYNQQSILNNLIKTIAQNTNLEILCVQFHFAVAPQDLFNALKPYICSHFKKLSRIQFGIFHITTTLDRFQWSSYNIFQKKIKYVSYPAQNFINENED